MTDFWRERGKNVPAPTDPVTLFDVHDGESGAEMPYELLMTARSFNGQRIALQGVVDALRAVCQDLGLESHVTVYENMLTLHAGEAFVVQGVTVARANNWRVFRFEK